MSPAPRWHYFPASYVPGTAGFFSVADSSLSEGFFPCSPCQFSFLFCFFLPVVFWLELNARGVGQLPSFFFLLMRFPRTSRFLDGSFLCLAFSSSNRIVLGSALPAFLASSVFPLHPGSRPSSLPFPFVSFCLLVRVRFPRAGLSNRPGSAGRRHSQVSGIFVRLACVQLRRLHFPFLPGVKSPQWTENFSTPSACPPQFTKTPFEWWVSFFPPVAVNEGGLVTGTPPSPKHFRAPFCTPQSV